MYVRWLGLNEGDVKKRGGVAHKRPSSVLVFRVQSPEVPLQEQQTLFVFCFLFVSY